MNYFVTGTDTGVGKTFISCALLQGLAARGKRVAGFKPVATGCDEQGRNQDALALCVASSIPLAYGQVNPYCFPQAIAPHLAARQAGVRIGFERILASYQELAAQAEMVIVEGAGGWLVPLNERETIADWVQALNLPVILVVGMRLGCLNHALLTVESIRARSLQCAGWVANILHADMPVLQENIAALQERIAAPLLGVVPWMAIPEAKLVASHLNLAELERQRE